MKKISIVILNWNGVELLKKFLPTVVCHSPESLCEVVVADNGSQDGSVAFVKKQFPNIRIIAFDKNLGFTAGYNRSIEQIDSKYTILLNSDVEVKEDWISTMYDKMEREESIAAMMPKIMSQSNPDSFEYAGACGGFIDKYAFPFCRGRVLSHTECDLSQYNTPCDIFWASGAAMMIRTKLYKISGGLDEDFFAHMEEIDLCWRLQNMGYRIGVEPSCRVFHVGGATLSYRSARKLYLNHRNNLFIIHKNTLDDSYRRKIFVRMVIDGFLAMTYLLMFKPKSFMAVIDAHKHYRAHRSALDIKRAMNSSISVSSAAVRGRYNGSIILSYISGKKVFSKLKF